MLIKRGVSYSSLQVKKNRTIMKIRQIYFDSHNIGYPFFSSPEDFQYYENIFKKINSSNFLNENWKPTMICQLQEVDIGKVAYAGQEALVLTERAKDLLSDLLKNNVEYLPLYSRDECHKKIGRIPLVMRRKIFKPIVESVHTEKQFLINLLNIKTAEVLDFEQSEFDYKEDDGMIYGVKKLIFKPGKIKDCHIFKINNPGVYFQTATFFSDVFKRIVEENNLTGLSFTDEFIATKTTKMNSRFKQQYAPNQD